MITGSWISQVIVVIWLMNIGKISVIDPLTEEDSGNYTCIITSRGMTSSYTTTLDVLVPPVWKLMPIDLDTVSGDNVVLNCQGSGQPPPIVKWHKTTSQNSDFIPVTTQVQLNGSLVLNEISKEDEGMYRCNISNGIGTPLVKSVIIRVIGTNVDIRSFSDLSNLVIDPLTEEDTGNYTCVVNARGMTTSYTTTLTVLVPPSWSNVPHDTDALNGDPVILNCKGSGTPKPSITWSRTHGENMDFTILSSSNDLNILSNGSLHFNSISKKR
ncbi:titin [Caerostris extrusa]|uniref:Titin n=1 Tax=Caerostris extrusa TaxID=172846 RepID=A0AAV4M7V0_CAEEX|nr:titin [Caerostris extrusa]